MSNDFQASLPDYFRSAALALAEQRQALNAADDDHGNHGDEMVALFELAAATARQKSIAQAAVADQMEQAAQILRAQTQNLAAQVYGRGLYAFAGRLRAGDVTLPALVHAVRNVADQEGEIKPAGENKPFETEKNSGAALKALVSGLDDWNQMESAAGDPDDPMSSERNTRSSGFGFLFDLGLAYMQAKSRTTDRIDALAETAVLSSPLAQPAYRAMAGKLAIAAFLRAMLA